MGQSTSDKVLLDRIENDFTYHAPNTDAMQRHERLRAAAKVLAKLIVELCPDSRERSLALTQLEQTVMWGNAAIAREQV